MTKTPSRTIVTVLTFSFLLLLNFTILGFTQQKSHSKSIIDYLPSGCDFYMVLSGSANHPVSELSLRIPMLRIAQQHLWEGVKISPPHLSQIALAGKLQGDTIKMVLLLRGDFDKKKALEEIRSRDAITLAGGKKLFIVPSSTFQLGIFIMDSNTISAGRVGNMKNMFSATKKGLRSLPITETRGVPLVLYLSSNVLKRALPVFSRDQKNYPRLEKFIYQIDSVEFHGNPLETEEYHLILKCQTENQAKQTSSFVRSILALVLFSLKQGEEKISDILSTAQISRYKNEVHVGITIPVTIFNSLFPAQKKK